eukprot:TRINITY_DN12585_c0_g3_i2.p1 TRINITY_DN12585_c0_g3~~TRINITY_DN12585_c0_g3_i2.p1  ORF type:complete len:414 (+),score=54.63 TRINITY_DN12585_c0_g3_i2:64-1305(+)
MSVYDILCFKVYHPATSNESQKTSNEAFPNPQMSITNDWFQIPQGFLEGHFKDANQYEDLRTPLSIQSKLQIFRVSPGKRGQAQPNLLEDDLVEAVIPPMENLSPMCLSINETPNLNGINNRGIFSGTPNPKLSFQDLEKYFRSSRGNSMENLDNIMNSTKIARFINTKQEIDNEHPKIQLGSGLVMNPIKREDSSKTNSHASPRASNRHLNESMLGEDHIKEKSTEWETVSQNKSPDEIPKVSQPNMNGKNPVPNPFSNYYLPTFPINFSQFNIPFSLSQHSVFVNGSYGKPFTVDMNSLTEALSKMSLFLSNPDKNINNTANHMMNNAQAKGKIGPLTKEERMLKIRKYKQKQKNWRCAHPVKRSFVGRSKVATEKPRVRGRFVKISELTKHISKAKGTEIDEEEKTDETV